MPIRYAFMIILLPCTLLTGSLHAKAVDGLEKTRKIMADTLKANKTRLRVSAENMANARSAGYEPKSIYLEGKKDRKHGIETVGIKKIKKNPEQMRLEYNPNHPAADENGYVKMPDINTPTEMVNIQQTRQDMERAMKIYEITTDLRYKMIGMIANR